MEYQETKLGNGDGIIFANTAVVEEDEIPSKNGTANGNGMAMKDISLSEKGDSESTTSETEKDPWDLPDISIKVVDWNDLSGPGKVKRVLWDYTFRQVFFLAFLYLFICSLSFLSSAFRLLGGKQTGEFLSNANILQNPVAGLMVGVLATVLVQSSSTSTSIVVAMVGSEIIDVRLAIPIIMGANIGTSVTNTIVSFGQIGKKDEFRRAFAGATVHDMFNWLCVLILLPIELATGYLFRISSALVEGVSDATETDVQNPDILKAITNPLVRAVIRLDSKIITRIAISPENVTSNDTMVDYSKDHLFTGVEKWGWSDAAVGACLLAGSLVLLTLSLFFIVKILHSALQGTIAQLIRKVVNANLPTAVGKYLTGYLVIIFGMLATIVVQSSSIFTSTLTPLVGVGVISLDRMYPFTLGSNIGTTGTSLLAALAGSGNLKYSLQIALCHLFFNISGILLWYPIPITRQVPIKLAKALGTITAEHRWFAVVYLIFMFFLFPLLIFGLSYYNWRILAGVMIPIVVLLIAIIVINVLQSKIPHVLPERLQTWDWLPRPLHSLSPYDKVFTFCCRCKRCQQLSKSDQGV